MQVLARPDRKSTTNTNEPGRRRSALLIHVVTVPQTLRFLRGQIGYLQARGLHVAAVASPGEFAFSFSQEEGIPVYEIEMTRRITPLRDLLALWKLYRLFCSFQPTIVHAQTPKAGILGTLAAFFARVPIRVYHIRGLPFDSSQGSRRIVLRWTERISCKLAHRVLAVSHSMRKIAIREGLCAVEKIAVPAEGSGNGVDAEGKFDPAKFGESARAETRRELGLPGEAIVIGFVGRLVRDKGIVELAQAWKNLKEDYPSLFLLIVGPLESQDPIPAGILQTLEDDVRVRLTGRAEDVRPLYAAMDVVAQPTYREGFPNVPLEAAAMALPVVATLVPGCVDAVVDGETGILIAPHDAKQLEGALRQYIETPELRRLHGQKGRERVLREFRPEEVWQAVYSEYVQLLQGR
jgi:glycosyltransferase involved in cell wall biosynthesis